VAVRPGHDTACVDRTPERVVSFRPRTVLVVLGVALLVFAVLALFYLAFHVITWILIAAFLAAALNPAVEWLGRRGLRRGLSVAVVFFAAVAAIGGLGALLIPPLVDQVRTFIDAVPDLAEDASAGRGPLGFLEREYGIVDRIRDSIDEQGAGGILGLTGPAVDVLRGVVTGVVGAVTVAFLTFFMLLEGPRSVNQFMELLPETQAPRWRRVGENIYRTIGGYTSGNLLISLIAGIAAMIVLFAIGSDYAIALALIVAVLDLIPLAGATIAAVIVSVVIFVSEDWVRGVIVVVFFVVYQQVENHILQPVIYGRTVQLSPLTVLIAVLIGAQLAGVLGALAAIPIAGTLLAIGREVLLYRRETMIETPPGTVLDLSPSADEEES
jgi:predicted PurR-regulated permease PerM